MPLEWMATADLQDELSCSICLSIYTDPVMLPCGHNFCRGCTGGALGAPGGSGGYSCPECRAEYEGPPDLPRNRTLGNIAGWFRAAQPDPGENGIPCTYCIHYPVPAAQSCLQCQASLCGAHLQIHNRALEHSLIRPIASFQSRKCSVHNKLLEYYCPRDGACMCSSCCLAPEHRGHKVEPLSEASEKKKEKLRKVLEKLSPEREETEGQIQNLQERRREVQEKAAGVTEQINALFRDIRERLSLLEEQLHIQLSMQKVIVSLQLGDLIRELEIKKDEMSRKIRHIEELCNMAAPLTVLQERESLAFCGAEGAGTGGRKREDIKVPTVQDLDVVRLSEIMIQSLEGQVSEIKRGYCPRENPFLFLDGNSVHRDLSISNNSKTANVSRGSQVNYQTSLTFQTQLQVLSTMSFPSGRHYWDVDCSDSVYWRVGVAYPSIERGGNKSLIGDNNKSWAVGKWGSSVTVTHDKNTIPISSCQLSKVRVFLDYEAGRLSFYELSEPIRRLHTFTAKFTEPLHAAFYLARGSVTITE